MGTHQPAESHDIHPHVVQSRQLDNGEDRLEGKEDSWLGNGEGKLEPAG